MMKSITKRLAAGAAALGAACVIAVVPATAAQAATGWDRCQPGYFCGFTGTNGTGTIAQYQVGDPDLSDGYGPVGMDNNIESFWNRTGSVWGVYRNIGGQQGWGLGPGAKLGTLDGSWANNISVITRN
ncbi:peptidase inhibitor family I36 protein [Planococcus sp. APC 4015]|nr:peptidase inhibitor family I36 protein [Planococcus sp. APC 4015]